MLYMVEGWNALKIGMAAASGQRIETHERRGWTHRWSVRLPTGDDAYNLEQAVLRHWRYELQLPAVIEMSAMPQGGATETVSASHVDADQVLVFVMRLMEEQGFEHPVVERPLKAYTPMLLPLD